MSTLPELRKDDEFARFASATREIVWRADVAGRIDYINPAWYRYTGAPAGSGGEETWWEHIHPDDVPRVRSRWANGVTGRRRFRIEFRVRSGAGSYRWFSASADPVREPDGRTTAWYGLAIDIDEERRARESMRTLIEAFPGLAFLADATGTVEYVNAGFLAFTGLTYDDALDAQRRRALVHPDDLEATTAMWSDAIRAGAPVELQYRFRRRDGEYRWLLGRVNPIADTGGAPSSWVGTATDIEDLHRTSELFEALTSSAPQLVWMTRMDGTVEFWNERMIAYTGVPYDPGAAVDWARIVHPDDLQRTAEGYGAALRSGGSFELQNRLRRADGVYRWHLSRAEPVRDAAGVPVRYVGTATDIDETKRTEDGMALLLEASAILGTGREIDAALEEVAGSVIERDFADACWIVVQRGPSLELAALDANDDDRARLLREMFRRYPVRPTDTVAKVVASGRSVVYPEIPDDVFAERAYDQRHRELIAAADVRSSMMLPLVTAGRTLGALVLGRSTGSEPYADGDLRTAEVLARRIAAAIEEAQTRDSERRLAETFQASALPRKLPSPGGIEIRAVYRAAEVGINVGGDWYDAFEISPWRLVLSCGDVAGKGVDAAAIMSLLRHGIRFAAYRGADPADVLTAVEAALSAEYPDVTATAFVAILDIRESRIRFSSAGHPPAMLRLPTGHVRTLETDPAPPLGAWPPGFHASTASTALAYGTILALYTDGATEVARDPVAGERRLLEVLREEAIVASTDAARYLLRGALGDQTARDDTAIVTLVFGRRRDWTFSAPDAMRAQGASASFERWLRAETEGDIGSAMTIFSELVGNVVRHAPGRIEIRAERRSEDVILHVIDEGTGFVPQATLPDEFDEGGRGLFIVSQLARSYRVDSGERGTYVRVVLPLDPRRRSSAA